MKTLLLAIGAAMAGITATPARADWFYVDGWKTAKSVCTASKSIDGNLIDVDAKDNRALEWRVTTKETSNKETRTAIANLIYRPRTGSPTLVPMLTTLFSRGYLDFYIPQKKYDHVKLLATAASITFDARQSHGINALTIKDSAFARLSAVLGACLDRRSHKTDTQPKASSTYSSRTNSRRDIAPTLP